MSKCPPFIVKSSVAAAVVLSVSACSSTGEKSNFDLGTIGAGIAKAGKATADVSRKTWDNTTYLLGFSDEKPGDNSGLSDEQLLAASQDSQTTFTTRDSQVLPLADLPEIQLDADGRPVLVEQATAVNDASAIPAIADGSNEALTELSQASSDNSGGAQEDILHEVAAGETLWDIAKMTTGDATNWHTIADMNNLDQSAAVFPGQTLIIPGELNEQIEPDNSVAQLAADTEVSDTASDVIADAASTELLGSSNTTSAQVANVASEAFEINDGETLWDFSKRTTGDATNWQAIAAHNGFTEKQAVTVRPGQTIQVPQDLVREQFDVVATPLAESMLSESTLAESANENADSDEIVAAATTAVSGTSSTELTAESVETEVLAAANAVAPSDAIDGSGVEQQLADSGLVDEAQLQAATRLELPSQTQELAQSEAQDTTIVEATYKTDSALGVLTDEDSAVQITENANIPAEIRVSGTYYPKAVYNNADFSSSLLMRVSPGTTLQVSGATGNWFEVETDKGVGFVHQRDIQ